MPDHPDKKQEGPNSKNQKAAGTNIHKDRCMPVKKGELVIAI
jgi:hypothetical protein